MKVVSGGLGDWVKGLAMLTCVLMGSLALAACGGSEESSSTSTGNTGGSGSGDATSTEAGGANEAGVQEATSAVESASEPVAFSFDTPLLGVDQAKGKKVFFLGNLVSIPFVQTQIESLEEAFGEVGVSMDTGGAEGDISKAESLLQQAVAREYDAIIINSIPSELLTNGLKAAKAAGVPVIQQFEGDPHAPSAADTAAGVFGYVTYSYSDLGRLMADWAIMDSGGDANAAGIGSSEAQASVVQMGALEEQFGALCPECSVEVKDVLLADWATRIGPLTGTLVGDPSLEYLIPVWDGMMTFVTPALNEAGAAERVKVVTSNADEAPMQQLASGEIIGANVGTPGEWAAWATADQTLRALTAAEPVADEEIPLRIFSTENIGEINIEEPAEKWYGDVDFRAEYRSLWGI